MSNDAPSQAQERKRYARDRHHGKPPKWASLYDEFFPAHTDGCSRHAKMIAEQLRDPKDPIRRFMIDAGYEPDHWAQSIEISVVALWTTRRERDALLGPEEVQRRHNQALADFKLALASSPQKDPTP